MQTIFQPVTAASQRRDSAGTKRHAPLEPRTAVTVGSDAQEPLNLVRSLCIVAKQVHAPRPCRTAHPSVVHGLL
jgi:hypothetical protein